MTSMNRRLRYALISQRFARGIPPIRRFLRVATLVLAVSGSLLLLVGIGLYILAQTQLFNRMLAKALQAALQNQLQAELSIGSMRVRLFEGVVLDSVALIIERDTLFCSPHVELRYTPEALLFRTIAIEELSIQFPRIHLVRRSDSTWNFEHLLRPSGSSSEPPSLHLYVRSFRIVDGEIVTENRFTTTDSLELSPPRFQPFNAVITDLQLRATVLGYLAESRFTIALDELSARDRISGWELRSVRGVAAIDSASLQIPSLSIQLPASHVTITEAAIGIGNSTLPFRAMIALSPLDPSDAYHIIPTEITLGRSIDLGATVEGSLDSFRVDFAHANVGSTHLRGYFTLHHLRDSAALTWNVKLHPSWMRWNDVRAFARWLDLPSIPVLNDCRIESLIANGNGDSVHMNIRTMTSAGATELDIGVSMGNRIGYVVTGTFSGLNLASFDKTFPTSTLTGRISLKGEGISITSAHAELALMLDTSNVTAWRFSRATILARLDSSRLTLDTLEAVFTQLNGQEQPRLHGRGNIMLTGDYHCKLQLVAHSMPLRQFLGSSVAPELLSSTVTLESSGTHLDSMRATLDADITELVFQDRAVFPFRLNAALDFDTFGHRLILLRSPQISAFIRGRYGLNSLGQVLSSHAMLTDSLIQSILHAARGQETSSLPVLTTLPDTLETTFSIHAQSLSLLAPLFAPLAIEAEGILAGSITAGRSRSRIVLDTISISRLIVSNHGGFYLASMPLEASFDASFTELDHAPKVSQALLRADVDSVIRIGSLRIVRPTLDCRWDSSRLEVATDTAWIENTLPLQFAAVVKPLAATKYSVHIARGLVGLSPMFSWSLAKPLIATMDAGTLTLDALLDHDQSDATLHLGGDLRPSGPDCQITLRTYDLSTLAAIPALSTIEIVQQLKGNIDSLVISAEGSWEHPRLSVNGTLGKLFYSEIPTGRQEITLNYDGSFLRGSTTLFIKHSSDSVRTALDVRFVEVPVDLSLIPLDARFREQERVAVFLQANQFPLTLVEPFLPAISQLHGRADAFITIGGTLPGNIEFTGSARYDDAEFLVPATNIRYRSRGVLSLHNNVLELDTIALFNDAGDLIGGTATASGRVTFNGLQPDSLNISIRIPGNRGLLVMSPATAAVNSTMYGRVVISTQDDRQLRQLNVVGTITEPRLIGFLSVEDADITFPPTTAVVTQTSSFRYQKTGEGYLITDVVTLLPRADTSIGDLPARIPRVNSTQRLIIAPGFTERLYTSVDVKFRRQIRVKMDFSSVEQLVAFVEQENRDEYLRFIRDGNWRTEVRGTLVVEPSSTYKFYNTFTASGQLRFTTGALDNPEVNLQAVYDGERIIGSENRRERYRVLLTITGTKRQPRVQMTYEINGERAPGMRGDSSRIMTNALLLLLFGRTQEELTGGSNGSVATSALDQSVNAARSAAVSAFLTNALQGGVIQNVNIDFGSSDVTSLSQARIMLTGRLFGANVTVGGSVADLAQNSQIMLDLSIGNALGIEWLRNLVAQFQATANPGQSLSRQQKQWEFRLGWRVP